MSNVKVNIELIGNEEDVLSFIGLCAKIELLGIWGANRTIPVTVDGDGSARLIFNAKAEVENRGTVDLVQFWKENNRDDFEEQLYSEIKTHYIGE